MLHHWWIKVFKKYKKKIRVSTKNKQIINNDNTINNYSSSISYVFIYSNMLICLNYQLSVAISY